MHILVLLTANCKASLNSLFCNNCRICDVIGREDKRHTQSDDAIYITLLKYERWELYCKNLYENVEQLHI